MSTPIDDAKKYLNVAGSGLHALEMIGRLASSAIGMGGVDALAALHSIVSVVDAVRGGLDGTRSLEHIDEEIGKLDALLGADAQSKADLDARFPK